MKLKFEIFFINLSDKKSISNYYIPYLCLIPDKIYQVIRAYNNELILHAHTHATAYMTSRGDVTTPAIWRAHKTQDNKIGILIPDITAEGLFI